MGKRMNTVISTIGVIVLAATMLLVGLITRASHQRPASAARSVVVPRIIPSNEHFLVTEDFVPKCDEMTMITIVNDAILVEYTGAVGPNWVKPHGTPSDVYDVSFQSKGLLEDHPENLALLIPRYLDDFVKELYPDPRVRTITIQDPGPDGPPRILVFVADRAYQQAIADQVVEALDCPGTIDRQTF